MYNEDINYKEIFKPTKTEKFFYIFVATVLSVKAIVKLHDYLKDKKNFSNLKDLKDFKFNTKYDVNSISDISSGVINLMYYIGENIQYYIEPEKIEIMKNNIDYMDEIFKYTEKDLVRIDNNGSKEIKCTKNDVLKFIKHSKKIETLIHNFEYAELTKVLGQYMKKYDNKKPIKEEDEVFIKLLKKIKPYFSKISLGLAECSRISRAIEREMKKNGK